MELTSVQRNIAHPCGIHVQLRHEILRNTLPVLLQARVAGDAPVVGKHPCDLARVKIGRGLLRHFPAALSGREGICRAISSRKRLNTEAQPRPSLGSPR